MLLDYMLSTAPQPLATAARGVIDVYVRKGEQPVFCNQIVIAVKIGDDADCLFRAAPMPTCSVNNGRWTIQARKISGQEAGLAAGDWAQFIFTCIDAADFDITYNLVFGISGTTTPQAGTFELVVKETSGTANNPDQFSDKIAQYPIDVALPRFYVQNFTASAAASPTVPCTQFQNGQAITLSWESNGSWFQLFKKNEAAPFWAGSRTTCSLGGGVATDATFILMATCTGDPGQKSQGGFSPVTLYDSLSVTIANPDLTPRQIACAGNATVEGLMDAGSLHVGGHSALSDTLVNGNLQVDGRTLLGQTVVTGVLNANSGLAALSGAELYGAVKIPGDVYLGRAAIASGAAIQGGLAASNGPVSIFGQPIGIDRGTFTAMTDGIVVGYISPPGDSGMFCIGWMYCRAYGRIVGATGGNVGSFSKNWAFNNTSFPSSLIMPVGRGTTVQLDVYQCESNQAAAPWSAWFFPLGSPSSGAMLEKISDDAPDLAEYHAGLVGRAKVA